MASGFVACWLAGCSTPTPRPEPEVDCLQEQGYDLSPATMVANMGQRIYWFGFGDETPGAYDGFQDGMRAAPPSTVVGVCTTEETVPVLSRPPDPFGLAEKFNAPTVCGRAATLRMKGYGHKDWGMAWATVLSPRSGFAASTGESPAQYQGIAFWARSEPGHDKTLLLLVTTAQTDKPSDGQPAYHQDPEGGCGDIWYDDYGDPILLLDENGDALVDEEGHAVKDHEDDCKAPAQDEGPVTYRLDSNGNIVISSGSPKPDECGNSFQRQFTLSDRWQLFRLPFDSFYQLAEPNRDPKGLDPTHIYQFIFRSEKEKDIDLWMDGLSFYREVGWQPPGSVTSSTGQGGATATGTTATSTDTTTTSTATSSTDGAGGAN